MSSSRRASPTAPQPPIPVPPPTPITRKKKPFVSRVRPTAGLYTMEHMHRVFHHKFELVPGMLEQLVPEVEPCQLTTLKKRIRELEIGRWPSRKIASALHKMEDAVRYWHTDSETYRALFDKCRDEIMMCYHVANADDVPKDNTRFHDVLIKYKELVGEGGVQEE